MHYAEQPPSTDLAAEIECLWTLAVGPEPPAPTRVFPDGCVELIVHVGPPWSWRPERGRFVTQPEAFVVGQLTRPFWLAPARDGRSIGARLRAAGARAFLRADLDRARDTVVPLRDLWGADAVAELVDALLGADDDPARRAVLAAGLRRQRDEGWAVHPALRAAIAKILERRGRVRIAPLARACGWSERHFARRFVREVGCLPRQFARTVRFQHLLALVGTDPRVDWAGLAWDSGFADQAHLIREFRRFTGATPGRLRDDALALARRFVSPERLARYFSAEPPAD